MRGDWKLKAIDRIVQVLSPKAVFAAFQSIDQKADFTLFTATIRGFQTSQTESPSAILL